MNQSCSLLIESLVDELKKGIALIGHLDDGEYTESPGAAGSIGAHFRHNLDFAVNLLRGFETGKMDYGARERELKVETDREYAIERISGLADSIARFDIEPAKKVLVRSEVDEDLWSESSVLREIEFVHSHTVHHHALIAAKLRALGVDLSREFGVAPSTLKYWDSRRNFSASA